MGLVWGLFELIEMSQTCCQINRLAIIVIPSLEVHQNQANQHYCFIMVFSQEIITIIDLHCHRPYQAN
jgi:hypothetical protein